MQPALRPQFAHGGPLVAITPAPRFSERAPSKPSGNAQPLAQGEKRAVRGASHVPAPQFAIISLLAEPPYGEVAARTSKPTPTSDQGFMTYVDFGIVTVANLKKAGILDLEGGEDTINRIFDSDPVGAPRVAKQGDQLTTLLWAARRYWRSLACAS